jgi:hypothetical protein
MRKVFFVIADVLNQLLVRKKLKACYGDRPGLSVCFGIVDGDLQVHVPEVAAPEALGHVQRFGLGVPVVVQPADIIEAGSVDYKRVAVPPADRVTQIGGLRRLGERASIQEDLAVMIVFLIQNHDRSRGLNELNVHGNRVEIHDASRQATLGWSAFSVVLLALLIERLRPWLHRDVDPIDGEVIQIFNVSGYPNSGDIRLAVRCLRRRGGEIRPQNQQLRVAKLNCRSGPISVAKRTMIDGSAIESNFHRLSLNAVSANAVRSHLDVRNPEEILVQLRGLAE